LGTEFILKGIQRRGRNLVLLGDRGEGRSTGEEGGEDDGELHGAGFFGAKNLSLLGPESFVSRSLQFNRTTAPHETINELRGAPTRMTLGINLCKPHSTILQ
jgi:hypothetical protein